MRISTPAARRFIRYSAIGLSTLIFDLCLLYILVGFAHVSLVVATPVCFLIAVSCNYVLSRRFVFKGTERGPVHGYLHFALAAGLGAFVTTFLVALLVNRFGLYFVYARVMVAAIIGAGNYLFNLHWNFKVAGKH